MKKTTLLLAAVLFTTLACKKPKPVPDCCGPIISPTYTLAANGDISGTYNGVLIEEYSSPPYTSSSAEAIFYNSPTAFRFSTVTLGHLTPATGTVTSVYVNSVKFRFTSLDLDYHDSTNTLTFPQANWVINGGSVIPSFSYTCGTSSPTYPSINNLPSTINRSQSLNISMSGVSGYDQVEIDIDDNAGHTMCMYAPNSASSVTFPADSLSKLVAGVGGMSVTLVKYNPQVLGSKNFLFLTTNGYSKSGVTLQ
jgi:hypothetical protein